MKDYIRVIEAAKILKVDFHEVRDMAIRKKLFKYKRIGKIIIINEKSLLQYVDSIKPKTERKFYI